MRPVGFVTIICAALMLCAPALSRDLGQWASDSEISKWFASLKMPDNPNISCCGEADAYWADSYEVTKDGEYIAIITDERPNIGALALRTPRPVGMRVVIPKFKLKFDQRNPTGHGIVFLSNGDDPAVYCYLAPGGV